MSEVGCVDDVDGEGFASFEGEDSGVEGGDRLRVDGEDDSVTCRAGDVLSGIVHFNHISLLSVFARVGGDGLGGVAERFPGVAVVKTVGEVVTSIKHDAFGAAEHGVVA